MRILLLISLFLVVASCQQNELYIDESPEELTVLPLKSKVSIAKYTRGNFPVTNKKDLLDALKDATSGDTIFVNGNAVIKLEEDFKIPAGVILASNRNHEGSLGAKIYRTQKNRRLWISVLGDDVEISGLRIQGPHSLIDNTSQVQGITNDGFDNLNINNCEISAFSYSAI